MLCSSLYTIRAKRKIAVTKQPSKPLFVKLLSQMRYRLIISWTTPDLTFIISFWTLSSYSATPVLRVSYWTTSVILHCSLHTMTPCLTCLVSLFYVIIWACCTVWSFYTVCLLHCLLSLHCVLDIYLFNVTHWHQTKTISCEHNS